MVTKQELDNILTQVNAILQRLDERLKALETAQAKQSPPKTARASKGS